VSSPAQYHQPVGRAVEQVESAPQAGIRVRTMVPVSVALALGVVAASTINLILALAG
jgi:hypothetical protein